MKTAPFTLTAHTVFFDIDDTITTGRREPGGDTVLGTLTALVAETNGITADAASDRIHAIFDPGTESMTPHYSALGITERALWDAVMEWLPRQVMALPGAVQGVKAVHAAGFRIYPATTNSAFVCRAKLASAGLATFDGSPYFNDLFGGAEVHPAGKTSAEFFSALLKRTNTLAEHAVHVGDLPGVDLRFAREAGIRQVVLPRGGQTEPWVLEEDGGLYLGSLETLPRLLKHLHDQENKASFSQEKICAPKTQRSAPMTIK